MRREEGREEEMCVCVWWTTVIQSWNVINPTKQWCTITISGSLTQLSECGHLMFSSPGHLQNYVSFPSLPTSRVAYYLSFPSLPTSRVAYYLSFPGLPTSDHEWSTHHNHYHTTPYNAVLPNQDCHMSMHSILSIGIQSHNNDIHSYMYFAVLHTNSINCCSYQIHFSYPNI